jgi:hypothetical protein
VVWDCIPVYRACRIELRRFRSNRFESYGLAISSFFPTTVTDWNALPDYYINCTTLSPSTNSLHPLQSVPIWYIRSQRTIILTY